MRWPTWLKVALCVIAVILLSWAIHPLLKRELAYGPVHRRPDSTPAASRPVISISADGKGVPQAYMQSARVEARVRLANAQEASRLARPSGKARQGPLVVADVTCEFTIACEGGAMTQPEDLGAAFPVFDKAAGCEILHFEAQTDGRECRPIEPADINVTDPTGRAILYDGCQWVSPPASGPTQKDIVRYSMLLPVRDGAAKFQYVVRSGGTWAKPIGSETVTLRVEPPLRLRTPGKFMPATREDGRWTWQLKDVRPTEDVEATIEIGDTSGK